MIPPPHGGRLLDSRLSPRDAERRSGELGDLPQIWPEFEQLMDVDKIGTGAYSPLEGFMDREALEGVLEHCRLPSSIPWSIPVLLTPPGLRNRRTVEAVRPGDEVALLDAQNRLVGLLHLEQRFPLDRRSIARRVYGTTDLAHPNVADLAHTGEVALSGRVELVNRPETLAADYEFTPGEMRQEFARRHWKNVAGYQTRNVPHLAHEHLQRLTLEREEIDGLLIHPVVGRLKAGDYLPEIVLHSYEILIRNYFPTSRVLLATLAIGMRYAGPRAALFLAIIRKNFGCSHYIVGRDQAGVGGFYDPYASQRIFDELPIGIIPLRYPESFYCHRCGGVATKKTCPHGESVRESTSQTRIRQAIRERSPLPRDILRPEIIAFLDGQSRLLNDMAPGPLLTEGSTAPNWDPVILTPGAGNSP